MVLMEGDISERRRRGMRIKPSKFREQRVHSCSWEGCQRAYFHKKDLMRHVRLNHCPSNDVDDGRVSASSQWTVLGYAYVR